MAMTAIARGFSDPVRDAQAVFRAVMNAMARPGTVQALHGVTAPAPLSPSAAAVGLALLDYETPVWLDPVLATADVMDWLRFHTGSAVTTDPAHAAFAFATGGSLPDFATFAQGTPDYPDRSTTLVITVAGFAGGPQLHLSGPGVSGTCAFSAAPLPDDLAQRLAANRQKFPCGIDLILVSADGVAALPRSVRVATGG
jgi:alpha-D-ribose 1-methylphosphonate 5-triphosphate synthase subunit PhnH